MPLSRLWVGGIARATVLSSIPVSWERVCWEKHTQMEGELQWSPVI